MYMYHVFRLYIFLSNAKAFQLISGTVQIGLLLL